MLKLTKQQANDIITKATQAVVLGISYNYRLGQSIWNNIPNEYLRQYIDNTYGYDRNIDFFYEKDDDIALEKFYKYFVEE